MTRLIFDTDHKNLPSATDDLIPVQLYGKSGAAYIGNAIIDEIRRLSVPIPTQTIDFLSIALAITAADTFVLRENAEDGWSRKLDIQLPLCEPERWRPLTQKLESAFHFLSGDMWSFEFTDNGLEPPEPYDNKWNRRLIPLQNIDCVSLFSGGLDSSIGVIDMLAEGRSPLLVSHAYRGDQSCQKNIANVLNKSFPRLSINADPRHYDVTDISMRTRSCNFLAFGVVGAAAVQYITGNEMVELFVPENGFISLNAPLSTRRIGSLSTRTTHPHFLSSIQQIFDAAGIPCKINNLYQFKTKGQMVADCKNQPLLSQIVDNTVSCSHWKRKNQQCGVCVPCIIRRAALRTGGITENIDYTYNDVVSIKQKDNKNLKDDLMTLCMAIKNRESRNIKAWVNSSGPLPQDNIQLYEQTFLSGLAEVEDYLKAVGAL